MPYFHFQRSRVPPSLFLWNSFPSGLKIPGALMMPGVEEAQRIELSNSCSTRIGIVLSAAANGEALNPYVIFPSQPDDTFSKYVASVDSEILTCGLQPNAFLDFQQFYNWTQTVFRPFALPKRKPHQVVVSEHYENAASLCKRQFDKCQAKATMIPEHVLRLIHPLHLAIIDRFAEEMETKWESWIQERLVYSCITAFPVFSTAAPHLPQLCMEENSSNSSDYSPKIHPTPDFCSPYLTPVSLCTLKELGETSTSHCGARSEELEDVKDSEYCFQKPQAKSTIRSLDLEIKLAFSGEEFLATLSLPHATIMEWVLHAWKQVATADAIMESFKKCHFI
ncbi:hypothetical protein DSO57_1031865 [Entomophthora muscae]|uniref:Uncharacterized protein n=1 Tax=Entomophthora muscae TaxID=34485 RepID=A0ACC2UL70_9FUNG|nr:hypothetical protein DSO57_1031865 [Entomophthora muscae]